MAITSSSSAAVGASFGFEPTASVVYANTNTTTLLEIINDDQISWLSIINNIVIFQRMQKNFLVVNLGFHFYNNGKYTI